MSSAELTVWRSNKAHKPLMVVTVDEWLEWQHASEFPAPLAEVPALIAEARAARQDGNKTHYTKIKNTLPAVSASGVWASRKRGAAKLQQPSGYHVLDYDSHQVDGVSAAVDVRDNALHLPYTRAAWLSPSGMGAKILVAIKPTTDPDEHKALVQAIRQHYDKHLGITLDDKTDDIGHLCYVSTDDDLRERSDPERWEEPALPSKLQHLADRISKAPEGDRHATRRDMGRTAGGLVAAGTLPEALTVSTLVAAALSNTATPEVARAEILEAVEYGKREPLVDDSKAPKALASDPTSQIFPHWRTEFGLAQYFAEKNKADLVVQENLSGKPLLYSWRGKHWQAADPKLIKPLVSKALRTLREELERVGQLDKPLQKLIETHDKDRGTTGIINSATGLLLRSDVTWDERTHLLICKNGMFDLERDQFTPGFRREDYNTLQTNTPYDPAVSYQGTLWEKTLREIFPDGALREYFQRMMGYNITGDTSERHVFIWHGIGTNGKTMLADIFQAVLGARFMAKLNPEKLMATERAAHQQELAEVAHARIVISEESNAGARLNSGLIKRFAGGGANERVRFAGGASIEFTPHYSLTLLTNHKPLIDGADAALMRRLRLIPFTASFTGREDVTLATRLLKQPEVVMAWLVDGARQWYRKRLNENIPPIIMAELEEYKWDHDPVGEFIRSICETEATDGRGAKYRVTTQLFCQVFRQWMEKRRLKFQVWTDSRIKDAVRGNGYEIRKGRRLDEYSGTLTGEVSQHIFGLKLAQDYLSRLDRPSGGWAPDDRPYDGFDSGTGF